MDNQYLDKYVAAQIIILLAILLLTPLMHFHNLIINLLGLGFLLIGLLILVIAIKQLGTALTPVVTPKKNAQLVTSGLYGIVRHPIYTGVIIMAIGWSFYWGSVSSFIASLVLLLFFNCKINKEESLLSKKFPEYELYKLKVKKKIIPFIF